MWWISSGAMTTADKLQASNFSCSQKRREGGGGRREGKLEAGREKASVKQM